MDKTVQFSFSTAKYFKEQVGAAGLQSTDLARLNKKLNQSRQDLKKAWQDGSVGYFSLPERSRDLRGTLELAADIKRRYKTLLVLGIGGSDLGARMLVRALQPEKGGLDIKFLGANTDPEEITQVLSGVDLKKTAINIVSKSGGTIEPMSTFMLVRDRLIRQVGKKQHAKHVIATTDRATGTLRAIADDQGYHTLPVPDDVGGRFSVLTPVGLFPAACAGIDAGKLLRGLKETREYFFRQAASANAILKFAGLHYLGYTKQNRNITVLMPYAARLDLFGDWFRQLWAESLGKRNSVTGREINVGLTPVAALGATDQHSQVQLYNEGPQDKLVTFIAVEKMRNDYTVPVAFADLPGVAYLGGHQFSEILQTERRATAQALAEHGKPNGTLTIPEINETSVGSLVGFFMIATSVMGDLLKIDPYNQPGVETGKQKMFAALGRDGF